MSDNQEKQKTKSDFVHQMIRITNLGEHGIDQVKKKVPDYINVTEYNRTVYVMTQSSFIVQKLKDLFKAENVEVVAFDQDLFQKSIKAQSALNWKKFKHQNEEYTIKNDNQILVVVHANPYESRENTLAQDFAKHIAKCCKVDEQHKIKFIVRDWLLDAFRELSQKKLLKDCDDKTIQSFTLDLNNAPMAKRPIDKAIIVTFYAKVSEIDSIIQKVINYERTPIITFSNPEKIQERNKMGKYIDYKCGIQSKDMIVTIDLESFPESASAKLIPVLKKQIKNLNISDIYGNIQIKVDTEQLSELKNILTRVKINDQKIEYTVK